MFRTMVWTQFCWLVCIALVGVGCTARYAKTSPSVSRSVKAPTSSKSSAKTLASTPSTKSKVTKTTTIQKPKTSGRKASLSSKVSRQVEVEGNAGEGKAKVAKVVLPVKDSKAEVSSTKTLTKVKVAKAKVPKVVKPKKPMFPDLVVPMKVKPMPWFLRKFRTKRWGFTWIVMKRFSRYKHILEPIFRRHRMPLALMMLAGNESSFVPRLRSNKQAMGMWQIMSHTGRRFGLRIDPWVDERRHAEKATDAMLRYMKFLYRRFRSWPLVIAAYNCGEGCVDRIIKRCPKMNFWQMRRHAKCWVPRETRMAVPRFFTLVYYYRNPKKLHHYPKPFPPLKWREVRTPGPIALKDIAKVTGLSLQELRLYNPALSSWATPPGERYPLRVPVASVHHVRRLFRNKRKSMMLLSYKVKRSSRLKTLVRRYKVPKSVLMKLNRVWTDAQLRKRPYIVVPKSRASKSWKRRRAYWRLGLHARSFRRRLPPSWLFRHWPGRLRNRRRRACYRVKRKTSYKALSRSLKFSFRRLRRLNPRLKRLRKGSWLRLSRYARCPYRRAKKANDVG